MTLNDQIRMRKEIDRIIEKAVALYDVPELRETAIKFDIRSHRFVGQAGYRRNGRTGALEYKLRINPKAVEEDFDDMLNDTIPHEVAHLVNYAKPMTGSRHNRGWKRVCVALGGNGQRCTSGDYDLGQPTADERKIAHDARRPYVYTDSKGVERRVTKQRHVKLQRPYGGYALTWRDNKGQVDGNSDWRYDKTPTVKQSAPKPAPKPRKPQARTRKGQMTKAQIARNIIRLHFAAGPDQLNTDQIIAKIAGTCGLSKGLAKTYFNNNLVKAMQQ